MPSSSSISVYDDYPKRILGQHFGMEVNPQDLELYSLPQSQIMGQYYRPWRNFSSDQNMKDVGSLIYEHKNSIKYVLDVKQFKPEEVVVKIVKNIIWIEAKHGDRNDDHGSISRHFIRKYGLPEAHDGKDVISTISSDGILTIISPLKVEPKEERIVPITQTGPIQKSLPLIQTSADDDMDENGSNSSK